MLLSSRKMTGHNFDGIASGALRDADVPARSLEQPAAAGIVTARNIMKREAT
jgi:hypothetical protein